MTTPTETLANLAEANPGAATEVVRQLRKTLWVPHSGGQREIVSSPARFRILRAGRRWGKTQVASHEALMAALSKPNQMVWWVANNDRNIRRGYRAVVAKTPRLLLQRDPPSDRANDRVLEFKNGSRIEFYTAGTPDALVGEGVNFLVVDEAALIAKTVWTKNLRPTLSDTKGRALIISTPRGRNWFWELWQRGQDPSKPAYASWHHVSLDSPYMDEEEVEDARDTLPTMEFQQEYLAEFVANAASMFLLEGEAEERDGQIRTWNAVLPGLVPPSGWVTLGVDLAKKEDFTVISGCNTETREPCFLDRFNEISWPIQEDFILETVAELESDPEVEGVSVVVDATGVGDVVYDNLDEAGIDVIPINFGAGIQKERMVRLLAGDMEHGRAWVTEEERSEFESYEYNITDKGRYQFEAATGHDDYVSAKMLQNWGVVHEVGAGVQTVDTREDRPSETVTTVVPDDRDDLMANPAVWND